MASTLSSPAVRRVLARLAAAGEIEDDPARARVRAREADLGGGVYGAERAALYRRAPIAVAPDVARLLYALAAGRAGGTVVEFGASLGVSTIHLAAGLRDAGGGTVVTTELLPEKGAEARANLAEAGLADLVEVRAGDATETLRDGPGRVDLLFLDGANDLYLPVLAVVEARLAPGALVVADLSAGDPHFRAYRDHVHDARHGYVSVDVPLDDGVVISAWAGR